MFNSVGKCLSVTADGYREYPCAYTTIKIEFENNTLTMKAHGDCCSESWFEEFPDQPLDSLMGKTIVKLKQRLKTIEMPPSHVQEHDRNHVYEFHIDDGSMFLFLLRNSSNGYYDGYITSKWKYNAHTDIPIPRTAHLGVVIGMPGCGKTTFVKNHYKPLKVYDRRDDGAIADSGDIRRNAESCRRETSRQENVIDNECIGDEQDATDPTLYHFFDDYLDDPTKIHTHIMPLLLQGRRVIVADPRLCDKDVFHREIVETFTSYIKNPYSREPTRPCTKNLLNITKQLTIVKYYQDAYQSILNVIHREPTTSIGKDRAVDCIKSIVKIEDSWKTHFSRYTYSIDFGMNVYEWVDVDTYKGRDEPLETVQDDDSSQSSDTIEKFNAFEDEIDQNTTPK
jgi:hypothetical protein